MLFRFNERLLKRVLKRFGTLLDEHLLTVVDVGAAGGQLSEFKPLKKHLRYVGFEPDERSYAQLRNQNDSHTIFIDKALYETDAEITFNLNKNPVTSSLFAPCRSFLRQFPRFEDYETVKTLKLNAVTMDNALASAEIGDVDFLKLDT